MRHEATPAPRGTAFASLPSVQTTTGLGRDAGPLRAKAILLAVALMAACSGVDQGRAGADIPTSPHDALVSAGVANHGGLDLLDDGESTFIPADMGEMPVAIQASPAQGEPPREDPFGPRRLSATDTATIVSP